MVIKNNFNEKDVNPLEDYKEIGKGSHSLDREYDKEKEGFIKENMENPVLQKLRGDFSDIDDDQDEDNWKLFR